MTTVKQLKQSVREFLLTLEPLPEEEVVDVFQVDVSGDTVEMAPWGEGSVPIHFSLLGRDGLVAGAPLNEANTDPIMYDEIRHGNKAPDEDECLVEEVSVIVVRRAPAAHQK